MKKILIIAIVMLGIISIQAKANNLKEWNEETVKEFMRELKPSVDKGTSYEKYFINEVTNKCISMNIPVPNNIIEFAKILYELPITDYEGPFFLVSIFSVTTNDVLTDLLLWGFTNYYFEAKALDKILPPAPKLIRKEFICTNRTGEIYTIRKPINRAEATRRENIIGAVSVKSSVSLSGLRNIGTPEAIDKLNKVLQHLVDIGQEIHEPGHDIDPNKYPKEAEEWLLNSPYPEVRKGLVNKWANSERSEKFDILEKYLKKLKKLPLNDPYFPKGYSESDKRETKKYRIKSIKKSIKREKRIYKNWLEDGKRMPLNYGCYGGDNWDNWEAYKKRSEKERKRRYGKYYKPRSKLTEKEKAILKNKF